MPFSSTDTALGSGLSLAMRRDADDLNSLALRLAQVSFHVSDFPNPQIKAMSRGFRRSVVSFQIT